MSYHQYVRFGALAEVGRFQSADATRYPRSTRVIVRSGRGLEVGEVLSPAPEPGDVPVTGSVLRAVTVEDELLLARLERHRTQAFEACRDRVAEMGLKAELVDAEPLFDGRTVWFYFLGPVTEEVAAAANELAEVYEASAQLRQFAETLATGCGPGCGTAEAAGGGCSGCAAACAVAGSCGTRHR